jgi:hypothetical protein
MSSCILADDTSYTISDVVSAQESSESSVSTIAASVSSTTEYNGMKQNLAYDYQLTQNSDGTKKMMVTTKGVFAMQYMVDTSDMSVTFLMADGSQKKVTASAEVKAQVEQMTSLTGIKGLPGRGGLYAALGMNKSIKSDAAYANKLKTDRLETDDTVIKVAGKKGNGKGFLGLGKSADMVEVEYENKNAAKTGDKFDEAIEKIKASQPKNKGAEEYKKNALKWFEDNKEKSMSGMIGKRTEHINMETGMVEEQEMYNPSGTKIGHMKVKGKMKVKDAKTGASIEVPGQMETEMTGTQGYSKTTTIINDMNINQPVSFEWKKPEKGR